MPKVFEPNTGDVDDDLSRIGAGIDLQKKL